MRMTNASLARIKLAEETLKGMILGGLTINELGISMNNAFAHGKVLDKANQYLDDDDVLLGRLFDAIEGIIKVGKQMDKRKI